LLQSILILHTIPFLLFALSVEAAPPSRTATYVSGTEILAADVSGNEDAIFNYLQAGVDTYADGTLTNADVHASANIQSDKLNLTAIAQSVANSGSTTLTGTFAANGTTNSIGNGGSDTLTLNVPSGMTLSAATTWTLTGALTFSGTIADLGTVTTADINGGTLDGVQIGGTTATGELLVNDVSDDADGLGSQGTSGQFLKSAGAGANPTWGNVLVLTSATTMTGVNNSGDIAISASKLYKVIISITDISADDTILLRVNSSAANNYNTFRVGANNIAAVAAVLTGTEATSATLGSMDVGLARNETFIAELLIDTNKVDASSVRVIGQVLSNTTGGLLEFVTIGIDYFASITIADFEILSSGGATMTGKIYVYEMPLS